jgi:hypothetical protein
VANKRNTPNPARLAPRGFFRVRQNDLCKARGVESFLAVRPERPVRRNMPVERLPRDPELFTERADARVALSHARHRKPELCRRHLWLASADASARAGGREPGACALGDQLALEFGERGEDAEDELAGRRRRIGRRALAGEDAQADSAGGEVMHGVDQVAEIAPEPASTPRACRLRAAIVGKRRGLAARPSSRTPRRCRCAAR